MNEHLRQIALAPLLAPDAGDGGGGSAIEATGAAEAVPSQVPVTASQPTEAAPPSPSGPVPGEPSGETAAEQRDIILQRIAREQFGVDIPGQSDAEILRNLVARYKQAESLERQARLAQQMMPHWSEFQKWQHQRMQEEQARLSQQSKNEWQPPEWDPTWLLKVRQDESGELVGPPDIVAKINAYRDWQSKFTNQFFRDPRQALSPVFDALKQEMRNEILQEMAMRDQYSQAQMIAQSLAGQPPEVQAAYAQAVQYIASRGVTDVRATHDMAVMMVRGMLAGMQPPSQAQQAAAARHAPSVAGAVANGKTAGPPLTGAASMREELAAALSRFSDADFEER